MSNCFVDPESARPAEDARVSDEGEWYPSADGIRYASAATPARGAYQEIVPGLVWIRMPLPIALDHINLWLLDERDGWTLIDTGFDAPVCRAAWESLQTTLLTRKPLVRIVLTHAHPDHMGLAAWLAERHRVPVLMSHGAATMARDLIESTPQIRDACVAFFAAHGMPNAQELAPLFSGESYRRIVSGMPDIGAFLVDDEHLEIGEQRWRVLETAGHADGHCALFTAAGRILVSGDQVLPTISSNVSLTPRCALTDPLGAFLDSLARLGSLDSGDVLVLPSHGRPFYGLAARTQDLVSHHHSQLDSLVSACADGPRCAWELLPVLFGRELHGLHQMLGLGEAIAHLEYLAIRGRLERIERADGLRAYGYP